MTKPSPYSSYLLRIWHSAEGNEQDWRGWLQDLATGERLGFTTWESLFAFLESASAEVTTATNGFRRKEADDRSEHNPPTED